MKDDTNDLSHVPDRQIAVNLRLEEWAKWVRPRRVGWFTQPMFRLYQSKARQWDPMPHIHIAINGNDAMDVEKAVAKLPEKHREIVRWAYVYPWVPVKKVCREQSMRLDDVGAMLSESRDMVKNSLPKNICKL